MRRFTRGVGRKAQAAVWGTPQGRWPLSCVNALIDLLKNAQSNATTGLLVMYLICLVCFKLRDEDKTIDGRTENIC